MKNKISLQIIFWLTLFAISLAFSLRFDKWEEKFIIELVNIAFYAAAFYINILVIFPQFYNTKRGTYYFFSLILLIVFAIGLLSFNKFMNDVLQDYYYSRHRTASFFYQPLWLLMIYLTGTVFSIQEVLNQQIAHNKKITEDKLKTELQLLKNQINPHFLILSPMELKALDMACLAHHIFHLLQA